MKVAVEEWELYNNGILLCEWFDLEEITEDEIETYVSLIKGKHGLNTEDLELFVADVEGDSFDQLSGDESLETAFEVQRQLENIDSEHIEPIAMMLDAGVVNDIEEAQDHLDKIHSTGETKMEDVAYNYVNECGLLESMPSSLQGYFDYESLGRDMEIEGTYLEAEDGTIWEFVA